MADVDRSASAFERLRTPDVPRGGTPRRATLRPRSGALNGSTTRRTRDVGLLCARSTASVRPRRSGEARPRLLRGVQHPAPGLRKRIEATKSERIVGSACRRFRLATHALIVAARTFDALGSRGPTSPRSRCPVSATSEHRPNAWATAKARASRRGDRHQACGPQMLRDIGHPFDARRARGLRRHVRERAGGPAHRFVPFRIANQRKGLCSAPATCRSSRSWWCTYGVGDHIEP